VLAPDFPEEACAHLGLSRCDPREVELQQRSRRRAEVELDLGGHRVAAKYLQFRPGMLRTPQNSSLIECFAGLSVVPRPCCDLDKEIPIVLAQVYGKDHPSEGRLDLFEELEDRAPPLFQLSCHFEDRGRTRGVALDLYGIRILFRSCFYAFFGRLFSVSPDHSSKPPHQTTNPQILASAKICRKRLYTLPLPDAGTTRVAPGASRTVHGERERHLAGPDGIPSLRERESAGRPCRTRPLRRAVRRPVLQPALSRLRDRRDHP